MIRVNYSTAAKFLKTNYWLILILLLAGIFRFWKITTLPGGLFPDEAANGLDVNTILKGHLQPFFERGNGREGLFFYFLAASVLLFGRGPWQHHIISAGFGFFEVLATYFLVKRMFGKNTALLTSFFMAISSYFVTMNRTAFRANMVPLFCILALFAIIKYFQSESAKQRTYSAILGGASLALGLYSYISFRMMAPLLVFFAAVLLIANRGKIISLFKQHVNNIIVFVAAWVVVFAPLGYYFLNHPGSFVGRAGQVSIFSKDLNNGDTIGTFLLVFKKTMLGFFTQGDLNWRQNVSGYPFLSPWLSPFFAAGLIIFTFAILYMLRQAWQKRLQAKTVYLALVAVWFWVMLVPEVTTAEGIPHGLRLAGVIPAMFIMPAFIINEFWMRLEAKSEISRIGKTTYAVVFVIALLFYNFYAYFGFAAASPDYYYAFRSDLTTTSNYLNERNDPAQTYLSLDKFSVQTVDYLTTASNNPYTLLDPAHTYEVALRPGDQVIFTMSTLFDRLKFVQFHPEAKLVRTDKNQFGQIIMLVYQEP